MMYNPIKRNFQVIEHEQPIKKVKHLRKMTQQRLKNIALYYLKRFDSSVANLRLVLQRRVNDYAYHVPDFVKRDAYDWIETILSDFQRVGYLNDFRYAEMKVKSYVLAGKSLRYIQRKLKEKGIDENVTEQLVAEQDFDPFDAAMKLARKRIIGPFNPSITLRKERRNKELAILVRAGFDYDVAVKVLDSTDC